MGDDSIRDRIRDTIDGAKDQLADRTGKNQTGMVPEVCQGCPYRGDAPMYRCDLCGCPTLEGFPLQQLGMTPEGCPREREHANRDDR